MFLSSYMSKFIKILKFIVAGGTSALSSFVLYYIFLEIFHLWYLTSSIIAFILSIFIGFILQKYLTFRDSTNSNIKKQLLIFFLISFGNLFINIVLMLFFVEVLSIDKLFAKVLSLGILACWNFFIYQKFIF